jgi:hypothetical protein
MHFSLVKYILTISEKSLNFFSHDYLVPNLLITAPTQQQVSGEKWKQICRCFTPVNALRAGHSWNKPLLFSSTLGGRLLLYLPTPWVGTLCIEKLMSGVSHLFDTNVICYGITHQTFPM